MDGYLVTLDEVDPATGEPALVAYPEATGARVTPSGAVVILLADRVVAGRRQWLELRAMRPGDEDLVEV